MMKYSDLKQLSQDLEGRDVLSVYINGEERDPARRQTWRVNLRHALDRIEAGLANAPRTDRMAFAEARRKMSDTLDAIRGSVRAPGWVGFFTDAGEHWSGPMAAPVSTTATWGRGARLAPYIRALKEERPVMVVITDTRQARIFRYAERKLDLLETVHARMALEPRGHMSAPLRTGFHSGTRGISGTDSAQRQLRDGTAHMLAEVTGILARPTDEAFWLVLGGSASPVNDLLSRLPADIAARAARATQLDLRATDAQIVETARQTASMLRNDTDLRLVNEALEREQSDGYGVTGPEGTKQALTDGRARELYFTRKFLDDHSASAEDMVRLALGSGTVVEQVSGTAAERLDAVGGVGARLRYAAPTATAAGTRDSTG